MTTRALDWFRRHDKFILQVEGGRVDHGCHNCDAPAALRDMIAFDEALDVCLAFQKQFPDTLLVITTDHANGNPGLNGIGKAYGQSSWLFENTAKVKCSFSELLKLLRRTQKYDKDGKLTFDSFKDTAVEEIKDEVKDEKGDVKTDDTPKEDDAPNTVDKKPDEKDKKNEPKKPREVTTVVPEREMQEILKLKWGYSGSTRRIGLVRTFLEKKGSAIFEVMNGDVQALGQLMANHTGISFTGNVHTGDYVVLTALGPGSERFRGFVQNTDVFHHYLHYAGIQFRNPEEEIIADGRFPEASEVESPGQYA
jgi:alkaline phosphatase